jgi:hypothetical protein
MGQFVYHEAAELPLADAERLIDSIRHTAEATAGQHSKRDQEAERDPRVYCDGIGISVE